MHYLMGRYRNSDEKKCSLVLVKKAVVAALIVSSFLDSTEVIGGNLVYLKTVVSRGIQQAEQILEICKYHWAAGVGLGCREICRF